MLSSQRITLLPREIQTDLYSLWLLIFAAFLKKSLSLPNTLILFQIIQFPYNSLRGSAIFMFSDLQWIPILPMALKPAPRLWPWGYPEDLKGTHAFCSPSRTWMVGSDSGSRSGLGQTIHLPGPQDRIVLSCFVSCSPPNNF